MELDLTSYQNKYSYKIMCCNKLVKVTRFKQGRCFTEMHLMCGKCNKKALFRTWHYDSFIPTKEEKAIGMKREPKRTQYIFRIKK